MSLLTATAITRIHDLGMLHRGDKIEAYRHREIHYSGYVEDTAPGLGIVWIRDISDGRRAILHADEYAIWQISAD